MAECLRSAGLELRGRVVGVLGIGSIKEHGEPLFEEYHLRLATIFAQHASVAIQNAQMQESMERAPALV